MGTVSSISQQSVAVEQPEIGELAKRLPRDFFFGAATSSYQIEGGVHEDGRGESIWDQFSHTPGKTHGSKNGDVACDHYHRYPEDIGLMADLGLSAYRFSVAWPRVIPGGTGSVNEPGLDFYDRLVDSLLEHSITPWATLYHWDLPQAMQDRGGWYAPEISDAFQAYVEAVVRRLGDRVENWITLNEPWVQAWIGCAEGRFAPGLTDGDAGAVKASHNLLRAHGRAMAVIRSLSPGSRAGITLDFSTVYPATGSEEDRAATEVADARKNRWFLDPVMLGTYPEEAGFHQFLPATWEQDMTAISTPIDFLGVNYYSRAVIQSHDGNPKSVPVPEVERMDSGWEVFPEGLRSLLIRLNTDYDIPAIYVTENGAAYADAPSKDGRIRDNRRIDYINRHVEAVADAIGEGSPIRGYFVWSLLDNFEWASAYDDATRFGIVYVDFETQNRTMKDSGHWYASLIAAHRDGQ